MDTAALDFGEKRLIKPEIRRFHPDWNSCRSASMEDLVEKGVEMFRIAICEDDVVQQAYEERLISSWARKNRYKVAVDVYFNAEQFLFAEEDVPAYDLLVLDIQMGEMNGMKLAVKLRESGMGGAILFLTGVPDYAMEGYEVGAVRYMMKPLKEKEFLSLLDALYEKTLRERNRYFLFEQGSDICRIAISDILYLEARGHYIRMYTISDELEWKSVFSSVAEKFSGENFFLLKRGVLVNLEHVEKITRTECILDRGQTLPVARERYKELNEAFIAYYKGKAD